MTSTPSRPTQRQNSFIADAAAAARQVSINAPFPKLACTKQAELQAVILYPSLATPEIRQADENKIRLFLIVEAGCREWFSGGRRTYDTQAVHAWYFIHKHLRLLPFDDPKISADLEGGGLYASEGQAQEGISVWYRGQQTQTLSQPEWTSSIKDRDGKAFANLRKSAMSFYVQGQGFGGGPLLPAYRPRDADVANRPLPNLFEIELKRSGLRTSIVPETPYTLAWMVTCVYKDATAVDATTAIGKQRKNGPFVERVTHWEHQDKLIYDYLAQQMESEQERHLRTPFLFDVSCLDRPHVLPPQLTGEKNRLRAYHPVIFKQAAQLKIAHFSDVHINSRHFSLAQSTAQVVEGVSPSVGKAVDNSCLAFKGLLDAAHAGKADAVFVSGDVLDFNRNIDPSQTAGAPKDQYPLFDLLKSLQTSGKGGQPLYPRGIDDMLMFSLVLYCYQKLKLPVFMTTGNHEAYQVPYGISPRTTLSTKLSALPAGVALPSAISESSGYLADLYGKWLPGAVGEFYAKSLRAASAGTSPYAPSEGKANEGIPADHNMTIYEALLAFGPSYGVVMKGFNFSSAHYDWFFTLFTPFADYCVDYNRAQCLIGLDWGEQETFLNVASGIWPEISDRFISPNDDQKTAILPRSDQGVSEVQKTLVESAISRQPGKKLLFSHFTLFNFDGKHPVGTTHAQNFSVRSLNNYGTGTFQCNRPWLFQQIDQRKLDYTFSGHSHRSAVYRAKFQGEQVKSLQAYDPGIDPERHVGLFSGKETPIVVSSCAGPIGVQNMKGELGGWGLMPPSGTLLDLANTGNPLTQITADTRKYPFTRPRFCVALDYIVTHRKESVLGFVPARWIDEGGTPHSIARAKLQVPSATEAYYLHEREEIRGCTASITFHVFDYKTHEFKKVEATMAEQPQGVFKCKVQIPVSRLLEGKGSKDELNRSFMAFAEIKFNGSKLANKAKYKRYNFDDAWFIRIDVSSLNGYILLDFRDTELPDFTWLGIYFPEKYPKKGMPLPKAAPTTEKR